MWRGSRRITLTATPRRVGLFFFAVRIEQRCFPKQRRWLLLPMRKRTYMRKLRHAVRAAGNQGSAPVEPRWSARCPTRSRQLQWQALSGGLDRLKEDRELVRQAMKQSRSCTRFISTGQKKLGERAAHHPDRAHLMPRFEPTRWQLVQKYGT